MHTWLASVLLLTAPLPIKTEAGHHHSAATSRIEKWSQKLWQRHEELWKKRELLFAARDDLQLPPNGAVYVGHMKLPLLGEQTFMLRIESRSSARITLVGAMSLDELAEYASEGASDESGSGNLQLNMNFNEPTLNLLARYRTRIRSTLYNPDGDYATLVICPPLLTIRVRLHRTR